MHKKRHWFLASGLAATYMASTLAIGWSMGRVSAGMFKEEIGVIVDVKMLLFVASTMWAWTMTWASALLSIRRLAVANGKHATVHVVGWILRFVGLGMLAYLAYAATQSGWAGIFLPIIGIGSLPASVFLNPYAGIMFYGSTIVFVFHAWKPGKIENRKTV